MAEHRKGRGPAGAFRLLPCAAGVLLAVAGAAGADAARAILDRARALDDGARAWTDRTQTLTLTIHDAGGGTRRRELEVLTKRYPDGTERAASFFLAPREVAGVAFLQWSRPDGDTGQWLYLPEQRRTRQVAARLRDERFMSTDFTYRDLGILAEFQRWPEAAAPARWLGEALVDGQVTDQIELRPAFPGFPYRRIVVWMDRALLTPRRLELHDREDRVVRRFALEDIRTVDNVPTAHRLEVQTPAAGTRTVIEVAAVRYNRNLDDELFTQQALERGRP